jgi:hypothetical protein
LRIWGLVNSGTWWLRDIQGGKRAGAPCGKSVINSWRSFVIAEIKPKEHCKRNAVRDASRW